MRVLASSVMAAVLAIVTVACGGGSNSESEQPAGGAATGERSNVALDKNAYPVFPDADAGADPAVPADQGGRGFTGQGWETNTNFDLIGDPRAVKGGRIRDYILDFPATLRFTGPSRTAFNASLLPSFVYESLLTLHPTTLEFMPALATHWQISPDKMVYTFRINPNARWSDGQPVTADDVVASWNFFMDKGLQEPAERLVYEKFERPVAKSKYIVSVNSKVLNWRNFLYFAASMQILPVHVLKTVDGATYLKEYNFKLLPGTGPYVINEADVVKGRSITIRRRSDYWAEKHRRNAGLNNFDEIIATVVRDDNLAFEMFKKGDLDYFMVNRARQWVEEMNFDRVQRGLIQKRKVFNDAPIGITGIAFNTRRPPYDDIRVRRALTHLLNRKLLIEKIFFNEYTPMNSYHPGGIYENPNNPKNEYDPALALSLLADAGWKDRDAQGRLAKNGRPLAIELLYNSKSLEPALTIYQEDLRKVGIGLNLRMVTFETTVQLMDQRNFDTVLLAYSGLVFPNPETSVHSKLADEENTNNLTGIKNARIDEILGAYDKEFDQQKRVAMIREIDGILANLHHFILLWQAPFNRIAYWDKFGQPESYFTRIGDQVPPEHPDVLSLWWFDKQKEAQLARAMGDPAVKLTVGPTEARYWIEFAQRTTQKPAPTATN